jgi:hypothetical protein
MFGYVKICETGHGYAWTRIDEERNDNYALLLRCPCGASGWGTVETHGDQPIGKIGVECVSLELVGYDLLKWEYLEVENMDTELEEFPLPMYVGRSRMVQTPRYNLSYIERPFKDPLSS